MKQENKSPLYCLLIITLVLYQLTTKVAAQENKQKNEPLPFISITNPNNLAEKIKIPIIAGAAQKENENPKNKGSWKKICGNFPNEQGKITESSPKFCTTNYFFPQRNNSPTINIGIRKIENDKKNILVIGLPRGILLPYGINLKFDFSNKTRRLAYFTCIELCFAEAVTDEDFISSLKRGAELFIIFSTLQNKPVASRISLKGFTKAFESKGISQQDLEKAKNNLKNQLKEIN